MREYHYEPSLLVKIYKVLQRWGVLEFSGSRNCRDYDWSFYLLYDETGYPIGRNPDPEEYYRRLKEEERPLRLVKTGTSNDVMQEAPFIKAIDVFKED